MNKCSNCGQIFEYPAKQTDDVGYTYGVCPYCESDDFNPAKTCPLSGQWIAFPATYADMVYRCIAEDLDNIKSNWDITTDEMRDAFFDILQRYIEERS